MFYFDRAHLNIPPLPPPPGKAPYVRELEAEILRLRKIILELGGTY